MKSNRQYKKGYNPNRFNPLDSAIVFILAIAVINVVPNILVNLFRDFFLSVLLYDYFAYSLLSLALSQGLLFLVAFIYCRIRRVNPFTGGGYRAKTDWVCFLFAMVLIAGIVCLISPSHVEFASDMGLIFPSGSGEVPTVYSSLMPLYLILNVILIAVVPAFVEEMLFRGTVMRGLESFGDITAVVLSSVMFSFMHGNFNQMILQFLGGLAIGSVVMITKNWVVGTVMHAFNNFFAYAYTFITELYGKSFSSVLASVASNAFMIVLGVVFVVVGVIYFGLMIVDKIEKKHEGKIGDSPYEKRRVYFEKVGDEVLEMPYYAVPNLRENKTDERRFFFFGKFRKINGKGNKVLAIVFLSVGILASLIMIFV